ncbi:homeobox-leucine zipper protein HDG8-like [Capsicum chacoense]
MTDSEEEHVGESSNSQEKTKRKRQCHRHNVEQIQQLEAFFKQCPHPDENQRNQLSKEAGLDPKQIKFWFQNKRTQTKTQTERSDNSTLRAENERFHCENMAMKEALKSVTCPRCDGPPIGEEERTRNIEILKMENQNLKEEHERVANLIARVHGRSFLTNQNLALPNATLRSPSNSSDESLLSQNICGSPIEFPSAQENNSSNSNVRRNSINSNNIPMMSQIPQENYQILHDIREKAIVTEVINGAMEEMMQLLPMNESFWFTTSDGRCSLNRENYERVFSHPYHRPYRSSTAQFESSKESGVVSMPAIELIQNFVDPVKWMNMFPSIVQQARGFELPDTEHLGGSIQMMQEKLHILSPLVEVRDFYFIRCCRRIDQTTWIMVDVSHDILKESQNGGPIYTWKYPSGCVIQDMGNGQSMVTWIEHVQIDDKNQVHRIFKDLVYGRQTFGAKRWIVALQRMSERCNFAVAATSPTSHDLNIGVVTDPEGVKNVMQTSQRMVKRFFEILSMTDRLDFPTSSKLNSGDRVSIRTNEEFTLSPKGWIVTAATSLCLPLSFQTVFDFFKDDKTRHEWDLLTGGNNVTELTRVPTGAFPGNSVTIIQPYVPTESNMLMIQESNIDEMGAFIIYAPIDLPTVTSVINGGDATKVSILPSGITISPDGQLASNRKNTGNAQDGSILTVAFQILISGDNYLMNQQKHMDAVASVHGLLSSKVLKVKAALGCSD